MLDTFARKIIDNPLNKIAAFFQNSSLTAIHITLIGFGFGIFACLGAILQYYGIACVCLILNRLCDGLDGAVARAQQKSSDFGGYLDILLDFIIYAGLPLSMAWGFNTTDAYQAAAFVIFTMVTTGVSFLAYAILCEKREMKTEQQGKKSFYFSFGLMEGTETILFLLSLCVFPHYFTIICYVFGGLCLATTAQRIAMAYHVFK